MTQLTFDEINDRDRRVLSFLREGNTPSQTSRKSGIPKSTVCQSTKKLEKAKLIRKKFATNYNILYDVVDRPAGEPVPQTITSIRVHNVSRKRKILTPHYQLSTDKRAMWEKSWLMRGKVKWHKYSFLGGVGEPSVSLTITPKTIIGYLDAKQYVIAESVEAAEDKAKQFVDKAIEQFVQVQAGFGNHIRIEGVSTPISKIDYGGQCRSDHPVVREIASGKVKDWFTDQSLDELGISGITEIETRVRENALIFERAMQFPDALPELLNPLAADITQVKAMMQGEITMQRQSEQMMKWMTSVLNEVQALRKEVQELRGK